MLKNLSTHSYTQAQLGEIMQEGWAAALARGQQQLGGAGCPGATVPDACTLGPKAWHRENVPSLLCASHGPLATPWRRPLRSGNSLLQLPRKVEPLAHRVPEASEGVFRARASGPCGHTCSEAQ